MSAVLVACCAGLGAFVGTLTPRLTQRLAAPRPARSNAECLHCGRRYPAGLSGWLRTGSACPACPAGPKPRHTVTAGAVALAVLGHGLGGVPELGVYLAVAAFGLPLAFIDLACLRLPNALVGAMFVAGAAPLTGLAVVTDQPERLGRAALAASVCFGAYLLLALSPRGPLGFGDVKLAGVLGFLLGWLGWPAVLLGLALPHLLNGPVVLALLATGRARRASVLPLGPALLAGGVLAAAVSGRSP